MIQFLKNITQSEPRTIAIAPVIEPRLWFSVWPIVSTSFVTRLNTSPYACVSKYLSGSRLILTEMSLRILRESRAVTVAMMNACA